jgi:ring-1,2-phenylacetyl-CoA epoxidase subunit PaaC
MVAALSKLWPLTRELFVATDVEGHLIDARAAVDPGDLATEFAAVIGRVVTAATLQLPAPASVEPAEPAGRVGVHTGAMRPLLDELQGLARGEPEATW